MNTFIFEANKLKNIQTYLEKNNLVLNHIAKCACDLNLLDYILELEQKRKSDTEQVTNELKNVWYLLQKKKKVLVEEHVNRLDLHIFKQDMIELQDKLHTLRVKLLSHNNILKDEEKNILEMNEIFRKKLEEWDKPITIISKHNNIPSKLKSPQDTNFKEVIIFTEFVKASNGHENGWSVEDHQLFLKLRHKYKNINDLAVYFNKLLPDITPEAVKQHEIWLQKYLFLKSKKNEALERWRKQKRNSVQDKNVESEKTLRFGVTSGNKTQHESKNDNDVHQQIMFWKAEKEAKRQEKQLHEQLQRDNQKAREENQRRLNLHMKQAVAKWREAKVTREQNEQVHKEIQEYQQKKIRAATANKMIKLFQTQDDLFIAKMRSNKLKEDNQTKRRSKSGYLIDRDPGRVLKPTKQWLLRMAKKDEKNEALSYIPSIREVPKLKIPEWRRYS